RLCAPSVSFAATSPVVFATGEELGGWGMLRFASALFVALALAAGAQAQPARQPQEAHGYTRYELLAPGSGKFKIIYDITAVRPGATAFFNPIRKGSIASDESVIDLATGRPLKFAQVSGEQAKTSGLPDADATNDYIRVELAHPVPADGGEARMRIIKTYEDPKSYRTDGAAITFD